MHGGLSWTQCIIWDGDRKSLDCSHFVASCLLSWFTLSAGFHFLGINGSDQPHLREILLTKLTPPTKRHFV